MKAKCPYCNNGCDKCIDGYIDVDFSEGLVYDLRCKKCRQVVGMHIDEGNNPPPNPKEEHMCCVICDSPQDLEWVLSAYSAGKLNG